MKKIKPQKFWAYMGYDNVIHVRRLQDPKQIQNAIYDKSVRRVSRIFEAEDKKQACKIAPHELIRMKKSKILKIH